MSKQNGSQSESVSMLCVYQRADNPHHPTTLQGRYGPYGALLLDCLLALFQ